MEKLVEFAVSGFWPFVGSLIMLYTVLFFVTNGILKISSRFLRFLNIAFRGWPPAHLDADGDWNSPKKNEESTETGQQS